MIAAAALAVLAAGLAPGSAVTRPEDAMMADAPLRVSVDAAAGIWPDFKGAASSGASLVQQGARHALTTMRVPVPFNGVIGFASQAYLVSPDELEVAEGAAPSAPRRAAGVERARPAALVEAAPTGTEAAETQVDTSPEAVQKLLARLNGDAIEGSVPTDPEELDKMSMAEKEKYVYNLFHKREKICKDFKSIKKCVEERPEVFTINKDLLYLTEKMEPQYWLQLHGAWFEIAWVVAYTVCCLVIWTLLCKHKPRRHEPEATKPEEVQRGDFHPVNICACIQGMPRTVFETLCCWCCMWSETVEKLGYTSFHAVLAYLFFIQVIPYVILGSCVSGGASIWTAYYCYISFELALHLIMMASMCRIRMNLRDSHDQGKSTQQILLDMLCVCFCFRCTAEQEAEFVELYEKHKHSEGDSK